MPYAVIAPELGEALLRKQASTDGLVEGAKRSALFAQDPGESVRQVMEEPVSSFFRSASSRTAVVRSLTPSNAEANS